MRALYQRKKGRDLFDLYLALSTRELDVEKILESYRKYIEFVAERAPSYKEFVQNMEFPLHVHDRFLIVDDQVYLLGASVKDMGKGLCAIAPVGFFRDIETHGEKFLKGHLCCGKSCTFALKKRSWNTTKV